jgi:hypothetical protein
VRAELRRKAHRVGVDERARRAKEEAGAHAGAGAEAEAGTYAGVDEEAGAHAGAEEEGGAHAGAEEEAGLHAGAGAGQRQKEQEQRKIHMRQKTEKQFCFPTIASTQVFRNSAWGC